jgi:MFS family permease
LYAGRRAQEEFEFGILVGMNNEPTTTKPSSLASNVRLRIVWISVLMAFGLYLTRVSLGEIVKTESFLKDPAFLESASTRFSVELTGGLDRAEVGRWIQEHVRTPIDLSKLKLPYTLSDMLTKQEAEEVLADVQRSGGEGLIRISKSQLGSILGAFFFSYALFQVPAGWFSDRLGARKMLAIYIFSWSLLTFLTGWVSSLYGLMFARLFFGFA